MVSACINILIIFSPLQSGNMEVVMEKLRRFQMDFFVNNGLRYEVSVVVLPLGMGTNSCSTSLQTVCHKVPVRS